MDRESLFGRWVLDPDDVAGFEALGLHGIEFGRHGDAVLSAVGAQGLGRALFFWRVDGEELVLTELASNRVERELVYFEAPERLRVGNRLYQYREDTRPLDPESGLFLIGAAGLRHGLACVNPSAPVGVESFSPLLLLEQKDGLAAQRLDVPEGVEVEERAAERVRLERPRRWALVRDGEVERARAVVVKAGEQGLLKGRTLVLRYQVEGGAAVPVGPVDSSPWEGAW